MTSQTGPYPQTESPPGLVNLAIGQPSPALLPLEAIRDGAVRGLGTGRDPLVLQYGRIEGYDEFRRALAGFLSARYGTPVGPDELLVSAGNSTALTLACQVFGRPGGSVVCEDPTYFLAAGMLRAAGAELVPIPVDEGGLRTDALADRLAGGLRPDLAYVIPSFQNPTGVGLAAGRAERLLELADEFDFVVVADEPYPLLHFAAVGPGTIASKDRGRGRVVSLGSFSKILAPGLRLGWFQGSPALIERLSGHGALASGGGLNPVVAAVVEPLVRDGFLGAHVDRLRAVYSERAAALSSALRAELPGVAFAEPEGGYFLWLDLGPGADATALRARSDERGVRFLPGARCALARGLSRFARLSFAFHEAGELREGVRRLRGLVEGG